MRTFVLFFAIIGLTACTDLPDVPVANKSLEGAAEYPTLVPLNAVRLDTDDDLELEQNVAARVANLKARAQRLKTVQFE